MELRKRNSLLSVLLHALNCGIIDAKYNCWIKTKFFIIYMYIYNI